MWDGDVTALMGEYLFALAHVCHVTPDQVPDLRLVDFARLIHGIDEYVASLNRQPEG